MFSVSYIAEGHCIYKINNVSPFHCISTNKLKACFTLRRRLYRAIINTSSLDHQHRFYRFELQARHTTDHSKTRKYLPFAFAILTVRFQKLLDFCATLWFIHRDCLVSSEYDVSGSNHQGYFCIRRTCLRRSKLELEFLANQEI